MPGIRQYTGLGGQFNPSEDPATFIITPRAPGSPTPGDLLYGPEVEKIKEKLKDMISSAEPRVFDYEVTFESNYDCLN